MRCKRRPVELRPEQSLPEATIMRWFFFASKIWGRQYYHSRISFCIKITHCKILNMLKCFLNKIYILCWLWDANDVLLNYDQNSHCQKPQLWDDFLLLRSEADNIITQEFLFVLKIEQNVNKFKYELFIPFLVFRFSWQKHTFPQPSTNASRSTLNG